MDVYSDREGSLLDHYILCQAFVPFLLPNSCQSIVQNGSLVVV